MRILPFLTAEGECEGVVVTCIDLTTLKQAEDAVRQSQEQLQEILDHAPAAIYVKDTEGRLTLTSRQLEAMRNAPSADLLGKTIHDFLPAEVAETLAAHDREVLSTNTPITFEESVSVAEGERTFFSIKFPLHDASGMPYALCGISTDITEQQHSRDLLRLRADEMETFAYSASHDLQAPLRTFEGDARWLLEDDGELLDEQGRSLCEEIIADAMHMKTLLDGLLEYSRIGRVDTEPVVVQVKDVLEWVLHDLQLEIGDSNATVEVPNSLPAVLYPEGRLTQIFSNLLSNALKFMAEGRAPEITIGWDEASRYHRFSVRDNGIGIAPEHSSKGVRSRRLMPCYHRVAGRMHKTKMFRHMALPGQLRYLRSPK